MNRRTLLKSAVGLGLVVPAAAVLAQTPDFRGTNVVCNSPCGSAPTEPPLDTRTPEQVYTEGITQEANYLWEELHADWNKYYKQSRAVRQPVFDALVARCIAELRHVSWLIGVTGQTPIIINGNVITVL